ncbi:PREDICTED: N-acetyllactosaminide beta-1,6-N-acetylglucosaminyl-transferase-like [Amphimedon queenslandica]|uniref:Protein xylosyltransferase n=1 Tax=Amphimedon queenslandica TaxID=400682 RepID=A0A1X7U8Q7_AMPQE|nr:PREDICTED: N-acetyllactosaminide beta-1,6-N-acetylglucosaminyl-transferase-like [Amphimedon queenslandica]|eukprot:XP_003388749.2 PREDICTED: N-acetyllactosaminide beta-1,6-N-acetylglucosaminyl-transferase-like [Amphimedon queenslandica]
MMMNRVFILKLIFLLFLGMLTGMFYVHWLESSRSIEEQIRHEVALRSMAPVEFGHHKLLAITGSQGAGSSSSRPSESLERDFCRVSDSFPREQLMEVKGNLPPRLQPSWGMCGQLIAGDNSSLYQSLRSSLKGWESSLPDTVFLRQLIRNCSETYRDFASSSYSSKYEHDFPIAYEMLIYQKKTRVQQYIRLLKYLYRPHNYYCIHIDMKSSSKWTQLIRDFASCFPNIVVTEKQIHVKYARSSILYAHFECFKELMSLSKKWKYVISLHGTELPLTTNREIVETLVKMNGSNMISKGIDSKNLEGEKKKWLTHQVISTHNGRWVALTDVPLGPIPYNMTVYKSAASANSAFSRPFIQFILTNKKAHALLRFLNDVHSGVEFFFSTMNALPEAPGGFHSITSNTELPLVAQRDWTHVILKHRYICKERKVVHDICIVSSSDLPRLYEASSKKQWLFHNKYFIEYDHVVMDCIERVLLQRNHHEYIQDCQKDTVSRNYLDSPSQVQ